MKNILFTTSTLPRFDGDPEPRFVLDLAKSLSTEYCVTILAPAAPGIALEEMLEGVKVIRYRYAPLWRLELLAYPGAVLPRLKQKPLYWLLVPMLFVGLYLKLGRLLRSVKFDCVHCHWFLPQGLVQTWRFPGADAPPFIVTSHGGDLSSVGGGIFDFLYRRVTRRAARVSVVSHALRENAARYMPGQSAADVPITPMGVDSDRFHPANRVEDYFKRYTIQGPVILFVGRLAEKKGVHYLLQAMAAPELRRLSCHLVVVGDGPERMALERLGMELKLDSFVHFLGPLDHTALPELYASADLFCAPSVVARSGDVDGLPTVILEASASGLPCISSPVGGIGDFIESGKNGLLVPPADVPKLSEALGSLLNDPIRRGTMAREARNSALAYNWPVIAEQFSAIYQAAMGLPGNRKGK
jgi:glycosyltransferase involved in cell wall biosynthesis